MNARSRLRALLLALVAVGAVAVAACTQGPAGAATDDPAASSSPVAQSEAPASSSPPASPSSPGGGYYDY